MFPFPELVAEKVGTVPTIAILDASLSMIVIVEVRLPSATTDPVPLMVEFATLAAPAVKTTEPPDFTIGLVTDKDLVSAKVEVKVHVEIPRVLLTPQTPYPFVVPVSVAEKPGVTPLTGLLFASSRVIVTVEADEPSATVGPLPEMLVYAAAAAP